MEHPHAPPQAHPPATGLPSLTAAAKVEMRRLGSAPQAGQLGDSCAIARRASKAWPQDVQRYS